MSRTSERSNSTTEDFVSLAANKFSNVEPTLHHLDSTDGVACLALAWRRELAIDWYVGSHALSILLASVLKALTLRIHTHAHITVSRRMTDETVLIVVKGHPFLPPQFLRLIAELLSWINSHERLSQTLLGLFDCGFRLPSVKYTRSQVAAYEVWLKLTSSRFAPCVAPVLTSRANEAESATLTALAMNCYRRGPCGIVSAGLDPRLVVDIQDAIRELRRQPMMNAGKPDDLTVEPRGLDDCSIAAVGLLVPPSASTINSYDLARLCSTALHCRSGPIFNALRGASPLCYEFAAEQVSGDAGTFISTVVATEKSKADLVRERLRTVYVRFIEGGLGNGDFWKARRLCALEQELLMQQSFEDCAIRQVRRSSRGGRPTRSSANKALEKARMHSLSL
jgi:hypothetical protein